MKKLFKILSVATVLALAAAALTACGDKNVQSKAESIVSAKDSALESAASAAGSAAAAIASAAESAASTVVSAAESAASAVASAVENADYSKPDITIESGDYAAMEAFAKELQSGGNEGKIVKITGTNSRSNFGAKASIMESDGNGKKIGSTYVIAGVEKIDDYPAEDAEITITGVVMKSDNGISCQILVPADMIETK